jgi:hypothetical protein
VLQPISARLEYDAAESVCGTALMPCAPAFDIVAALDEATHPGFWSEMAPVLPRLFDTVALVVVDFDTQLKLPKMLSWLQSSDALAFACDAKDCPANAVRIKPIKIELKNIWTICFFIEPPNLSPKSTHWWYYNTC